MKLEMRVEIEKRCIPSGLYDYEVCYPQFDIVVDFKKGSPAVMYQRNGDPGWPADPAEIELLDVALFKGDGIAPTKEQMWDWVQEWLDSDQGYQFVCDTADRETRDARSA